MTAAPRRLCVIGNSHVACLKLAAEAPPAGLPPADWFAASANSTSALRLAENRFLTADDSRVRRQFAAVSGGRERIDLADYDAFALVGICVQLRDVLRFFRSHCLWRHREWRAERALISDANFRAYLAGLYGWRPAYGLARRIAAVRPGAPVLLLPAPAPNPTALGDKTMAEVAALRDTPYFAELDRLHRAIAARAAAAAGARLVLQRDATLAAPGFTAARFGVGSVGLQGPRAASPGQGSGVRENADAWHMNPAFGRTRLEDIAAALAA